MKNIVLPNNYSGLSPGFVRATIKIANPGQTDEQIDAALQQKLNDLMKDSGDGSCEFCSS